MFTSFTSKIPSLNIILSRHSGYRGLRNRARTSSPRKILLITRIAIDGPRGGRPRNVQSSCPGRSRIGCSDRGWYAWCLCVCLCVCVCVFRAPVSLHTLSPPPPISHFSIRVSSSPPTCANGRLHEPSPPPVLFSPVAPASSSLFLPRRRPGSARAGGFPPGVPMRRRAQKNARVIKGKIFLCPVIGGCRGNTRATSASNYFQTLRIERAPLHRAVVGIARHTHFSVSPDRVPPFHRPILLGFSPIPLPSSPFAVATTFVSLPPTLVAPSSPSRVLIVDG